MIPFRELDICDREQAEGMLCNSGCMATEYSFASMYIWRNAYDTRVFFTDNRMIVTIPGSNIYNFPKGGGDLAPSMDIIFDDAHEKGLPVVIRGLTGATIDEFTASYGDRFEISEDRDNADYVYTADKLRYLKGRHLSSKRNHIKHFERNGDWELKHITSDNIGEARAFMETFYQEKSDPDLAAESDAISQMFDNYDELGFIGGLLYQKGSPVAFSAGTKLGINVVDVHFEKAMPGVDGAYTMINREFANLACEILPETEYFNREEDMGLEGLRRAKESYHPDLLIMKYIATEK